MIERFTDGGITCLKFAGTLDESFEGIQAAADINCETLVLDLGGVRKISSFGIREWVDFITAAATGANSIVMIECAPKVVDQLNMVANFAGSARVYSFYAPFRCDYCNSEHRVLLDVGKDFDAIKAMKLSERPCPTCKESMYFDDDGATFFSYLASQGTFALEPAVISFLAAKLDYRVATAEAKLKIDKVIEGRVTYLRLTGGLDGAFPRDKLAEGLEGIVIVDLIGITRIDPAGAAEWRSFVGQVTPHIDLLGVQPVIFEKICRSEELGLKTQVLDCMLPYACKACGHAATHTIDIAEHRAVLEFATAPELPCPRCRAPTQTTASEAQMVILRGLPVPSISNDLARTIAALRARRLDKRVSAGLAPQLAPPPPARDHRPASVIAIWLAIGVLVVAAAITVVLYLHATAKPSTTQPITRSAETRPSWIRDARPGSASCVHDRALHCTGVSQPLASEQEAEDEASDVAYEVLAFERAKAPTEAPNEPRAAAFAAAARDPQSAQAMRDLHDGRHAVARLVKRSAGPIDARYWEQFATSDGPKFIAYAHVLARAELAPRTLFHEASALGATVSDLAPELAWRFPKLDHGAVVTKLDHGPLQDLGLSERAIVLAIAGHDVTDAATFAKIAETEYAALVERGGTLRLLVQTETGDPRELATQIAGKQVVVPEPTHPVTPPVDHSQGVNVWDRFDLNAPKH